MPLLIYISGYLSKFNFKKILIQLALPFCVFRLLFVGFEFLIYGKVQFIWNEFGILWYLFSLILFKIMLHLIVKLISERYCLLFFIISIFTGLIAGFIPLGEELSFSRTFAFFPFFVLGYLVRNNIITLKSNRFLNCFLPLIIIVTITSSILLGIENINLFCSSSYKEPMDLIFRILQYVVVFSIIYLLFSNQINKKVIILTLISKFSMYIYLIHYFVIILIRKYKVLPNLDISIIYAILISIVLTIVLAFFGFCFYTLKSKLFLKKKIQSSENLNKTDENIVVEK